MHLKFSVSKQIPFATFSKNLDRFITRIYMSHKREEGEPHVAREPRLGHRYLISRAA